MFWHLLVLCVESGPTLLCSNRIFLLRSRQHVRMICNFICNFVQRKMAESEQRALAWSMVIGSGFVPPRAPRGRLASTCKELDRLVFYRRVQEVPPDLPGCNGRCGTHMADLPGPARSSQTSTEKGSRRMAMKTSQGGVRGKGRVRRGALLTLAAVMLVGALAAKTGRSKADTQWLSERQLSGRPKREVGGRSLTGWRTPSSSARRTPKARHILYDVVV